jgi:hypothetical protein
MGGRGVLQSAETALEVATGDGASFEVLQPSRGLMWGGCGQRLHAECVCGGRGRGGRVGDCCSRGGSARGGGDAGMAMRSDVELGSLVTAR